MGDWLRFFPARRPRARVLLAAAPHAGGGASAFASWSARLPGWLDLCALAAPGRESRLDEPPCRSVGELADAAAAQLARLDVPIALFGHSLGSWVAYEIAHRLVAAGRPPVHLFAAAARPPHILRETPRFDGDVGLLAYLSDLEGMPIDVVRDRELLELYLPIIRADLELARDYLHPSRAPLPVRTTVLCGSEDSSVPRDTAARWRDLVTEDVALLTMPGSHFFVRHSRDALIATLIRLLRA